MSNNSKTIQIGKASFGLYDGGCFTRYDDGASWGAEPHDTPDYRIIANRLGYPTIMAYCVSHEIAHHVFSEIGFNRRSKVLWNLAHGLPVNLQAAVAEECAVQALQAFVQLGVRPIVGDCDWTGLRQVVLDVTNALQSS